MSNINFGRTKWYYQQNTIIELWILIVSSLRARLPVLKLDVAINSFNGGLNYNQHEIIIINIIIMTIDAHIHHKFIVEKNKIPSAESLSAVDVNNLFH